jgi:two-component system sensor histidine kinase DesK
MTAMPIPIALVTAPSPAICWRLGNCSRMVVRLQAQQQSTQLVRLATAGAVASSVVLPALELARIATASVPTAGHGATAVALVATACYLPLYVRHVWYGLRGRRPAGAGWTLAAIAVVILGAVPVVGTGWLPTLHVLAVSVLLTVRPPWSLLAVAGLVAATAPLAIAFGNAQWAAFTTATVMWRGAAVFVLVWLVGATRRLHAVREVLAEEGVARERLRIDGELRRTVGTALEAIIASAQRVNMLAGRDLAMLKDELRALVTGARRALADARRMISGYQRLSLRAELDSAASLLTAAGIQTRLELPAGTLPELLDAAPRATLRAFIARLLRDDTVRHCTILVTRADGRVRLELRCDGSDPAATQVAVA